MTIQDEFAKNAYIYAYPIDEAYKYLYNTTLSRNIPLNEFQMMDKLATASYREHPTINNDTLHIMGWIDVAAEPIIISVPDVDEGRYWILQTMDMGHYTNSMYGARLQGGKGGNYMYAAYDWQGDRPEGVDEIVRVRSNINKVMGRVMTTGHGEDLKKAQSLQDQWKLKTLSEYLGKPSPAQKERNYPDPAKTHWLERVNLILADGSMAEADEMWLDELKAIGLEAGKTDFTQEQLDAAKKGEKLGMEYIKQYAVDHVKNANKLLGTREELQNGDRIDFAEGTFIGQWGLPVEESVYYQSRKEPNGDILDGSKHAKYLIKMDAPKVSQFWSVTVYRSSDLFMVENPLNRFSRSDRTMDPQPDGSYLIELGTDCTGQENNKNFLPIPEDQFYVVYRMYGPDQTMIEGKYQEPEVVPVKEFATA